MDIDRFQSYQLNPRYRAERTVETLMKGGSDPVITKKPEGAWTAVVTDKAKSM
mgnify:CR=1 FL=1